MRIMISGMRRGDIGGMIDRTWGIADEKGGE